MNPIPVHAPFLKIGRLPSGPRGLITDVKGVTVGHSTLDDTRHHTGVTVILPAEGNVFAEPLVAAAHVINGFGKTTGIVQIQELGTLETPIALTSTLCVGKIADALIGYTLDVCAKDGTDCFSVNPVVGETNSSNLSDDRDRPLGEAQFREAVSAAAPDFAEGAVGAGRGTVCFGMKGGIGSASRLFDGGDGQTYTMGVLVQTNFGCMEDFRLDGQPVGERILRHLEAQRAEAEETDRSLSGESDQGSIMMVVATDLPLDHLSLSRILRRAEVGLVRTGSHIGHGSGDIVLGFTTANRLTRCHSGLCLRNAVRPEAIESAFRAVAECTEEAIYRSLLAAGRVTGYTGATAVCLADYLPEVWDEPSVRPVGNGD